MGNVLSNVWAGILAAGRSPAATAATGAAAVAVLILSATAESLPAGGGHWAFQPLRESPAPSEAHSGSRLDAWIVGQLAGNGLSLNPEADRATLLRRLALVLTGLPPTPAEQDSFLRDPAPDAYERKVEQYLASPRHGERWAQHWLDAAGYADSNGYFNADTDRPLAYRYRDYVIRSLNRDKPFDQFVREQLAGDELSGWRPGRPVTPEIIELLEATHYLRNGQDGSGESDGNPDEVRVDRYYALESSVQIIGSSLLGLTFQCAKCHDHKFEPVTQKDYFALQAVLYPAFHIDKWVKPNDRVVDAQLPGVLESWQESDRQLNEEEARIQESFGAWSAASRPVGRILFADDFDGTDPLAQRWSATAPGDDQPAGTPPVALDSGEAPGAERREGRLRLREGGGSGDRWLSTRTAMSWRPTAPGRWIQATFDLVALKLEEQGSPAERIGYVIAAHDFNDNSAVNGGNLLIDGNPNGPTSVHSDYPGADSKSRGTIGATGYRAGHNYGVRITATGTNEFTLEHLVDGRVDGGSLKLSSEDLPDGGFAFEYCCGRSFVVDRVQVEASDDDNPDWSRRQADYLAQLAERKKALERELGAVKSRRTPRPDRIAWMTDVSAEPPVVPLLKRGNPKTPGEPVNPDVPGFLKVGGRGAEWVSPGSDSATTGRRLAWSRWLTEPGSAQSALLARVTVNRIWQHYFGVGLVTTPDNFGRSGAPPSNAGLLDALARVLVDSGWSLKAVHRAIARSAVFRQSAAPQVAGVSIDPADTWLWRYPVHRLDAEAVRDSMLAVAGILGPKASGPYVPTPRQSDGEVVVEESRADAFSRSVFLQHRRTQVPTFLGNFDAPSVVFNCTRRAGTTMPLQSLSLLNSEFTRNRGADLARRLDREAGEGDDRRVDLGFRLTCGRMPDASERTAALRFLDRQRAAYAGQPEAERQVWNDFCQSLLGLNAFLYLE